MTVKFHHKVGLLVLMLLPVFLLASGCGSDHNLDRQVREITRPYRYDLVGWEFKALAGEAGELFTRQDQNTANATANIVRYFNNTARIKDLETAINAVLSGNRSGDLAQLQQELDGLREESAGLAGAAGRGLEKQVRETLSEQGIFNPIYQYTHFQIGFPPVSIHIAKPPYLLVISPRDRIANIKRVFLLPEINQEDMEKIEEEVDSLGVSSLVVGFGGLSTYPSYIAEELSPRFTINTIVHEWTHHYLAFTPLGFRYILDQTGIRPDYEIATINETVADIIGEEIGGIVYEEYFPPEAKKSPPAESSATGFDFNKEMREIRKAVDDYLARGEIEAAEAFMEQKRQYLSENGYYIRKLNQAYFAFHGTYANSPTSISPIGAEMRKLREDSASVKDFLDSVAGITSHEDLIESLK
jgi:hypothetical protein